jgi:Cd2+/Zn2+-exporting ATPase
LAQVEEYGSEHGSHEHSHVGSLKTRLIITLVGGLLIVNGFLANKFFFPTVEEVGAISALIGALILGIPILIGGLQEMSRGRMHMSTLVAIAVLSAFVLADYQVAGIVAFFMLLASLIEEQTAAGARESVEKLMQFQPNKAELASGKIVEVSELKPGDVVVLRPGDRVPADGKLLEGETTINEATITGESLPADKTEGDDVFAGTHNLTGAVKMEVTRAGEDTTLGKVKKLILEAEATKTRLMQIIDRYAEWYTPVILMIAAIVGVFTKEAERVITVLVIACPCAFVLATPTAMVAGLTAAARLGILIKNVVNLESAGDITAVVFDKTGTLTTGQLTVTRLAPSKDVEGSELLRTAASIESHSKHPIAKAVVGMAQKANIALEEVSEIQEVAGKGVKGKINGQELLVGRHEWLSEEGVDMSDLVSDEHEEEVRGLSLLYVARNKECLGWIGLEDRAREEAKNANKELRELGVDRLTMLTGDRWSVARKVAGELGCTEVQAQCLPEQKLHLVETMRKEGYKVAVVGDGVNDAPALAAGDLGIAMGAAGSDVAIGSASIALMSNDLGRLPILIRLSRKLRGVIIQNLLMGGLFVVGGATMASFGYFGPIVAALLHNVSSFLVIFNSARLVRFEEELTESEEEEVKKPSPTTRPATV